MIFTRANTRFLAALVLIHAAAVSGAAFHDRGNGMIYDDVLNVTWMQDASMAGKMTLDDAQEWTSNLVHAGVSGWRLPIMDVNNDGVVVSCTLVTQQQCRDSELGYLIKYGLMGDDGTDLRGDQGPFLNIQWWYWSSTLDMRFPPQVDVWAASFWHSFISPVSLNGTNWVWPVRTGDVLCENALIDIDCDGVLNGQDNCANVPNQLQRDTDADGFGNRCDADFDQNCVVNALDLGRLKTSFFTANPDADLDGSGVVNATDLGLFKSLFFLPPGPSDLANICE